MAVTINGGAPSAPQIAEFQSVFQLAPSSHVSAGGTAHAAATTSVAGFMSAADKTKLNGVASNANNYSHPNHTGDVTSTGDGATVIATDAVTNAKLANMATATFKGRTTAGTGDPEDLSATQATALLNTFTTSLKGLAPASGGGTTNYLRADGTWAAPAGGGTVTSVGMSVPTGLSISGSPVTGSGTLAVTLTSGYVIPTQAALDAKLDADLATEITTAKTSFSNSDKGILLDAAASDVPKTFTGAVMRTVPVGTGLATTGTVNLDFATLVGSLQTITATGNITFTASNYAAGRAFELRIAAGGSTRTLAWPSTWVAYGAALPTSLASGKILTVAVRSTGTTEGAVDVTSALSV